MLLYTTQGCCYSLAVDITLLVFIQQDVNIVRVVYIELVYVLYISFLIHLVPAVNSISVFPHASFYRQEFQKILGERAVAYLNVDGAVSGNYTLAAKSTPLLYNAIYEAARRVRKALLRYFHRKT